MYQVESICSRAIWINEGRIILDGNPAEVTSTYGSYLENFERDAGGDTVDQLPTESLPADGRIISVKASSADQSGPELQLTCCKDDLLISIHFWVSPRLPDPTIAVVIATRDGKPLGSAISKQDGIRLLRDNRGEGNVSLQFSSFSLLKGRYLLQVYLACEHAIHSYDMALEAAVINVTQSGLEQGVVHLPRNWLGSFSTAP
jgi:lipopolysaccharide transport system ATP-binding protein